MERVIQKFGFGSTQLKATDFAVPDQIIQLGVAPNRIDILTGLTALNFDSAWAHKMEAQLVCRFSTGNLSAPTNKLWGETRTWLILTQ